MMTRFIMMLIATCIVTETTSAFQSSHMPAKNIHRVTKFKGTNDLYAPGYTSRQSSPQDVSNVASQTKNSPSPATNNPIVVQGDSLRTWSYKSQSVDKLQIILSSEGRPLEANVELWNGPNNTPCQMRVYAENGQLRPFNAVVESPYAPNTVAIRNVGQMEFPLTANVYAENVKGPTKDCVCSSSTIQGGALRTFNFEQFVDSVQLLLKTDGRPLNARIEVLQGPSNNKQVIELYAEDGFDRPFFCILETPGSGNVIRVVNTGPLEFPMTASVVPNSINKYCCSYPTISYTTLNDNNVLS
tara:strand:+ start:2803 stop:3702 length:900 start_codon:yes stop_codon:yes gene_type:complete